MEEFGGLIWVYMGPTPAPVLPKWDVLSWDGHKDNWSTMLPCNWLQCQENSLDPLHFQWLHRYWGGWQMSRIKPPEERDAWNSVIGARGADHRKIGFEVTDYGVIKRRLVGEEQENDDHWAIGHPILFPNILRVSHGLEIRVPVDDTHTLHVITNYRQYNEGESHQTEIPFDERPLFDENGRIVRDFVAAQDQVAWVIQGPISDRTTERLGVTDVGVIMFRRMLDEQAGVVEDGGEPINVYREDLGTIVLPCEHYYYPGYEEMGGPFRGTTPRKPDVEAVLSGSGARLKEWDGVDIRYQISGKQQVDSGGALRKGKWMSDGREH